MFGQPVAVDQQREPVVHPVQQLRHPERVHPRRGQLDRERHPIEARDELGHGLAGLRVDGEARLRPAGSVGEQRHRLGFLAGLARSAPGFPGRVGQGQRPQPVPCLPGDTQRFPAGGQHPHVVGAEQQPAAHLRGRADHLLAVVQHQQQLPSGQRAGQRVGRRYHGQVMDAQRRGHRGRHRFRSRTAASSASQHPVGEAAGHPLGHLACEPRLPGTTRPGQRHQPVFG